MKKKCCIANPAIDDPYLIRDEWVTGRQGLPPIFFADIIRQRLLYLFFSIFLT